MLPKLKIYGSRTTTIRGVVERLRARSLIEVLHDPDDGRKLLVRLSRSGLALIDRTIPFATEVTEQTYGSLNAGERVALIFLLRRMLGLSETS